MNCASAFVWLVLVGFVSLSLMWIYEAMEILIKWTQLRSSRKYSVWLKGKDGLVQLISGSWNEAISYKFIFMVVYVIFSRRMSCDIAKVQPFARDMRQAPWLKWSYVKITKMKLLLEVWHISEWFIRLPKAPDIFHYLNCVENGFHWLLQQKVLSFIIFPVIDFFNRNCVMAMMF